MNEDVKSTSVHIHSRADELIACLEGEIAKRDEELAACRVAVENCEVFRARIAELEDLVLSLQCKAIDSDDLRAELSALKAQEPVAWAGAIEYGVPLLMVEPQNWKATPLYAAPVSEPKAQGVVMPEPMKRGDEGGSGEYGAAMIRGYNACLREVARLNAAPVQQVSVPDGSRLVTTDWLKRINRDLDACQKLIWANLRGCDPSYYEDAQERLREIDAMLAAAPAAPAADAGYVFYGMDGDHP